MRSVILSVDVFAALWGQRQAGEDSENAILERLLGLPKGPPLAVQAIAFSGQARGRGRAHDGQGGIYNQMFDVRFPAGFKVFRTYKGREYSAVVRDGRWEMNGETFPSLFALSMAIIDSRENPWMHWKYRDADGRSDFISGLRKIPPELDESVPTATEKPLSKTTKTTAKNVAKKAGRR